GRPDHPEMLVLSNAVENGRHVGLADAGITWHTDMSAYARPPRCSLLYAKEIPFEANGVALGDTIFTSAAAAYDALPHAMKDQLSGRRPTHSYLAKMNARKKAVGLTRTLKQEHLDKTPPVPHPVFRTPPLTRRTCISVTE